MDREVNSTLSGGGDQAHRNRHSACPAYAAFCFDEPEAGIDLWSFASLIDVFQKLRGTLSGSLVIISHQERILQIADEIVLVSNGGVTEKGPAPEVLLRLLQNQVLCEACRIQKGGGLR